MQVTLIIVFVIMAGACVVVALVHRWIPRRSFAFSGLQLPGGQEELYRLQDAVVDKRQEIHLNGECQEPNEVKRESSASPMRLNSAAYWHRNVSTYSKSQLRLVERGGSDGVFGSVYREKTPDRFDWQRLPVPSPKRREASSVGQRLRNVSPLTSLWQRTAASIW